MQREELIEAIAFEMGALHLVVEEVQVLVEDVEGGKASIRDRTAAGAFLAQFYTGIENILKRILRYTNVAFPSGETWHLDLFNLFCEPGKPELPVLFDPDQAAVMGAYRRFRHVVHHGYGFQLDWDRMAEGIGQLHLVCEQFEIEVKEYLKAL